MDYEPDAGAAEVKFGRTVDVAAFAAMLLAPVAALAAPKPTVLEPISPWNVDWQDNSCQLVRKFGPPNDPTLLVVRQLNLSNALEFTVSGAAIKGVVQAKPVSIDYGVGKPRTVRSPQLATNSLYGASIIVQERFAPGPAGKDEGLRGPDPSFERRVERIGMAASGLDLVLKTGRMGAPLQALHNCVNDLFSSWGIDTDMARNQVKEPRIHDGVALARAIQKGYPPALDQAGKSARVLFLLVVDVGGGVTDCHILQTTEEGLNGHVCREASKARFAPARGEDGQPVTWYYTATVVYKFTG
ncbi:energy transducer TonB [Novosphingobium resinovorum]|uniref:energy transducer TonB n=1 Tax=Novosphingobium resinovorum TaxID=158500 RepID=UPI002ED5AACD|nr:energy transducer TonB [Novosphingobium resinovorum]